MDISNQHYNCEVCFRYLLTRWQFVIWDDVFKERPGKTYERQPLKSSKLNRPYQPKVFKGYIPKNLLGPFLSTLLYWITPGVTPAVPC